MATVSTAMCGDVLELRRECSNFLVRVSRVPPCGARWVELETLAGPMGVPWADGPPHQLPAAVRAHVHEDSVGTVGTPRALVRADSSVVGLRREVAITELAVRAYFQDRHHLSFYFTAAWMLARTHTHRVLAFAAEVTGVSVVSQRLGSEAGARSPAFMHAAMRACRHYGALRARPAPSRRSAKPAHVPSSHRPLEVERTAEGDGNKRTGVDAALTFLALNGHRVVDVETR